VCGFAGFRGSFPPDWLTAAGDLIAHRGPDDSGVWVAPDGGTGLVHRRLSIIDLTAAGHQPMLDPETGLALAYNGEIYNYRELRAELQARGRTFRSASDTEVLLQGLAEFGDALLPRLNGIFAFACYDSRNRELLLARDHFGVKPLYVALTSSGVLFSSELKALLLRPEVSRTLDPAAIASYLTFLWSPGVRTPLRAVQKLEPGHALRIGDHGVRRFRYYESTFTESRPGPPAEELKRELDGRLATAVERQLVADVPVGAFLSGGLDSSAVVSHAVRRAGASRLKCFTIAPKAHEMKSEGMSEDFPYAMRVARELGVGLEAVGVDTRLVERLPQAVFHLDEPQADPAALNVMVISQLARRAGIKVLLSGAAGDDLFAGYRRHVALGHERYWACLPRSARASMARAGRGLPRTTPLLRRAAKALQYADLEGDRRLLSYFYWLAPEASVALFTHEHRLSAEEVSTPMLDYLQRLRPAPAGLNRMLALEQAFFLPDHNLNYTDKLAMAYGVEVRVPLLDIELAAFANSLRIGMKLRGTETKWLFKKAMEPYLPREVIYRPKTGFGAPLRHWLRHDLAPWVNEYLGSRSLRSRGLFDPVAVAALLRNHRAGRVDASYTLFALICFEIWCRTFIDQAKPAVMS